MDPLLEIWTTVGSAGTLNLVDLAKVSLHQSIVQLGVGIIGVGTAASEPHASPIQDNVQAVVRYNILPVAGLFPEPIQPLPGRFKYGLRIRYLNQITAKLMEVDLATGAENQLILFDSKNFPESPNFQVHSLVQTTPSSLLDFVGKGYYVEATLTASAIRVGSPAAISIIKLLAEAIAPA
jgi:hypothetical protein